MSIASNKETAEIRGTAKKFLEEHKKMVLTVLDRDGYPNSSLLLYVTDGFTFYFGTCKSFGKYAALHANPHVSVAVVQESIDPLQVLDVQGVAEEVPGEETAEKLAWFTSRNTSKYYIKDADDYVMFKINPLKVRWLDAMSGDLQICDIEV